MDRASDPTRSVVERPWLLGLKSFASGNPASVAQDSDSSLPPDTMGLALSGEGVRGAAFCLGVVQALARSGWLRHVDYLSTVSGGGYTGAFLGRYFDSYRGRPAEPDLAPGVVQDRVARGLVDPNSEPIDWLRRHSNYLAPGGARDEAVNLSEFLRSLLSVYLVLGIFFLAVFGALNAIGYGPLGAPKLGPLAEKLAVLLPISRHLPTSDSGPWVILAEAATWLALVPLMLAYWLISRNEPDSLSSPILLAVALVAGGLLLATGSPLATTVLLSAVLWSIGAWVSARREEGPADPFHPYRRVLAREHLNRRLAFWLSVTISLLVLTLVDAIGRWLARGMLGSGSTFGHIALAIIASGAIVLVLALILRGIDRWIVRRIRVVASLDRSYLWALATFLLGAMPALVMLSFLSHSLYGAGETYAQGLTVTVLAAILSLLLGTRECIPLLNQTGSIATQAGRLSRTFLGATNTSRRVHPEGQDVTRPILGDDVPFDRYHPERAGGPLHLINCSLNETFDISSFRSRGDRQAENLAVGPAGMSTSPSWHALWRVTEPPVGSLDPAEHEAPDPFLSRRAGPILAEPLDLEDWVAISGSLSGPRPSHRLEPRLPRFPSLVFARSGYWWDSGLDAGDRLDTPIKGGLVSRIGAGLARLFRSQTLLLSELTGRFGGPWSRHWYLTNGANFEGTGAYELLRRRIPFLILCDATNDPQHLGANLARLVRLARVDLGAEVTEADPDVNALTSQGVPTEVIPHLGSLADLLSPEHEPARRHATLLQVRYPEAPPQTLNDPWQARRQSWILYLKATETGDEPVDVRGYAATHPDFPDETLTNPSSDEPQWESYRRLGEHIGGHLFLPVRSSSH